MDREGDEGGRSMNHRMVLWRMNEQDKHALMVICSQFSHLGGIRQQLLKAWEQAEHTETTTTQGEK